MGLGVGLGVALAIGVGIGVGVGAGVKYILSRVGAWGFSSFKNGVKVTLPKKVEFFES